VSPRNSYRLGMVARRETSDRLQDPVVINTVVRDAVAALLLRFAHVDVVREVRLFLTRSRGAIHFLVCPCRRPIFSKSKTSVIRYLTPGED
jgi:hypothetical protein